MEAVCERQSIADLVSLKGRVAVVTGAGGFLGSAMAEGLAEAGADVVLLDQNEEAVHQKSKEISERSESRTLPLITDLAEESRIKAVPKKVIKEFGRLDILINSAAFVGHSDMKGLNVPLEAQTLEAFRKVVDLNLNAMFLLIKECAPALASEKQGSVINIASIYGMGGPDMRLYEGTSMGNAAAYGASKGGVIQLTRWFATVLAPDIRVNTISPGGAYRGQPESFVKKYEAKVPLGRMANPEDFKGAALYLASNLSKYVTGHNLVVDGGWSAW